MLDTLKEAIRRDSETLSDFELATENMEMDDIRSAFLDDPETLVIGAEEDPEIKRIVDQIPEDKSLDEPTESEIDKMVESFIPESNIR